ncbi:MAG: efflux RND transporter permease subunit [Thermoanaerobaculia bacterium]|nr:efflux RND transporter permease subunit [Thermoanaerobaculia bacterium]
MSAESLGEERSGSDSEIAEPATSGTSGRRLKSFSTSRPVAVLMVFLAAVVFGYFSYERLPVTLMPELSYPTLTVRTEYPGAAPEEVENDISRPVEEALGVVGGLQRISSISRAGVSDVVLEFTWKTDMSDALQDTLEKLDLVFLPPEAERPLILRFDPSLDPVMELSLSGSGEAFEGEDGLRRLRRIAELQIRRALEPVAGVAAVRLRGGLEEEIQVRVDSEQLRRTGLSIQRVIDRLRQENVNVAGGTIQEGRTEFMVRTLNEYSDLEQIKDTIVARIDGRDVRVRDVARVEMGHKERQIMTRAGGDESVQIDVYKEADANMVALSKRVRERLGDFDLDDLEKAEKPASPGGDARGGRGGRRAAERLVEELYKREGAELRIVADRSLFIESSINEVRQTAIIGGLLAVLVLFVFLQNLRTTAIVAVSIPISLLVTFAPLNLLDVSLNIMSLGGLALGVGMLVDSSIVVLESIYRCREEGDDILQAAVRGTLEVRGAVIASTFTSIAVFFPMVFVEGVAGQAFGDLGLAVVVSLLASVVVAVSFIPMLASRGGRPRPAEGGSRPRGRRLTSWRSFRADLLRLKRWRRSGGGMRWLGWAVGFLYLFLRLVPQTFFELVLRLAFGIFLMITWVVTRTGWLLFTAFTFVTKWPVRWVSKLLDVCYAFYPRVLGWGLKRLGAVVVLTLLLFGALVWIAYGLESELLPEVHQGEVTVELSLPVGTPLDVTNRTLSPVERQVLAEPGEVERLLVTVGYDAANSTRSDEGEHTARFKVLMGNSLPDVEMRVVDRLRGLFETVPDLEARVTRPVLFSFRTPIEIEIHGNDLVELKRWSQRVREALEELPELADVESTLRSGAPEMQVIYDRDQLVRYGLDVQRVAEFVRNAVQGFEATRFNLRDRRIPIVVRFSEEDRRTVEDVREVVVNPGGERPIPLDAVADVMLGEGPSEVRRIDGRRVALVRANLGTASLGQAVDAITERLQEMPWPADMTWFSGGQSEEWDRSRGSLLLALALSVFLVYVIMAAQFESLIQPLVILFTIPLAFFGTVLALRALGISLSIVVFLGMIMLAGIVVNNAIVLVDYVNTLRRRGLSRDEALITAGKVRLRPILMTTATTALGLLPMALGLGDGAEIRRPMAIAVISGLVVSTVLTLVIIPAIYAIADRLRERLLGEGVAASGSDPVQA